MNPTSQLEHPCRSSELPACQGDGTPARAVLTRATAAATCAEANYDQGERRCLSPISATNLSSTSTPETHQLSCARLSPRRPPPQSLSICQHACVGFLPASSEGVPDSPRASPIPSDAAIGAATPVVTRHRSHLLRGHPCFSWGVSAFALGFSPATIAERCDHLHSLSRHPIRVCFRSRGPKRNQEPFPSTPTKASTF
jgi:hypothetical protein